MRKQLLGLFGGSFDPIHLGHITCARALLKRYPFYAIHFIPCQQQVLKTPHAASAEQRLTMLEYATSDTTQFIVDPREIERETPSYSIETLIDVRKDYPETSLVWILGSDAFAHFAKWHRYHELLDYAHFLVIPREGFSWQWLNQQESLKPLLKKHFRQDENILQQQSAGAIIYSDIPAIDISATNIREKLEAGASTQTLIPATVAEYIKQQNLYQG